MVRAALHFGLFCSREDLFLLLSSYGGFPVPCFFLKAFPCSFLGCLFFCFFTQQSTQVHFPLLLFGKLKCRQTLTGLVANSTHATATAMHFPADGSLIFLTGQLTNNRYSVDTGAICNIEYFVPCTSNASPSGPFLKGADDQPIPSWGFVSKIVQFQGKLFTAKFLQAAVAGPILGIDFLRKLRITVAPETSLVP